MTSLARRAHWLFSLCISLPLLGCASRPMASNYVRTDSYAISAQTPSRLGRAIGPLASAHAGQSGFRLLTTGADAFFSRIAAVQAAEHTLDVQYYIVEDDTTGKILLEEILRAADRGVRVRILIDNMNLQDVDETMAVLNTHRQIEIRGFNPVTTRDQSILERIGAWIGDFDRYTKRMHNKALIADNQVAVMGGRNLGDEYFDASSDFNFNDTDVLVAGPITAHISRSFDKYWNSDSSYPLRALDIPPPDEETVRKIRAGLKENWEKLADSETAKRLRQGKLPEEIADGGYALTWAPAELSVDRPEKVETPTEHTESPPLERLDKLLEHAESEFIAVTPYFVPRPEGVEWLGGMVARGMSVRVLTNSLAATDVPAVHVGYSRYREEVIKRGVELYEMKPILGKRSRQNFRGKSSSRASLHSKVYVVDRKHLIIGSFNFDPRSIERNTEVALVIHSPELARQVVKMFEETIAPTSSFRMVLEDGKGLAWVATDKNGKEVRFHSEPDAGIVRTLETYLLGFMPESQL